MLATLDVTGTSTTLASDLPTGAVFWRLYGRVGAMVGVRASPTWQFNVGARTAPVNTSWGTTLDANGDGFADIVVTAPGVTASGTPTGRSYVYPGGRAGLATAPAISFPQGLFGVASAGDVDGDGFSDVLVADVHRALVYAGGPGGPSGVAMTTLVSGDPIDSGYALSIASAGDVNGDGYADVVVGEPGFDHSPTEVGTGRAFVYLGGRTGLSTTSALTLTGTAGRSAGFGGSVLGAGDVNGDGYGDIIVGTSYGNRAYVFTGSPSGLTSSPATTIISTWVTGTGALYLACTGDVNGDGYADVIRGEGGGSAFPGNAFVHLGGAAGLDATAAITLPGLDGMASGFADVVGGAGDVNGDGFGDVLVGDPVFNNHTGRVFVYLGGAAGVATSPATTLDGADGTGANFANVARGAGDVDGDTFADVAVSETPFDSYTGRLFVFLGSNLGLTTIPATSITGPDGPNGQFGASVASGP